MTRSLPLALAALLLITGSLHAQRIDDIQADASRFEATRVDTRLVGLDIVPPVPAAVHSAGAETQRAEADDDRGWLSFRTVAHTLGGAIVGGWLGYVGAQVVRSDWDKETNGSFSGQRTTWVASGAVVGMIGSHLIGLTRSPGPGPLEVQPSRRDVAQNTLSFEAIRRSGAQNAYALIESLRREWLIPRGINSWAEAPQGTAEGFGATYEVDITPGRDKIIVYLDDIKLGGVDEMYEIPTDILTGAEFIDSRRATYLYGTGHAHGVIRLSTEIERR